MYTRNCLQAKTGTMQKDTNFMFLQDQKTLVIFTEYDWRIITASSLLL